MATVSASITGIRLLAGPESGIGNRYTYMVTANFGTYTASSDNGEFAALDTEIQNRTKKGRTFTIRQVMGGPPGIDSSGTATYIVIATNSSGTVAVDLGGTTAEANRAASKGVNLIVIGDES